MSGLLTESKPLIEAIAKRQAYLVLGAGVSIGATNNAKCASWKGLLLNGIDRCAARKLLSDDAAELQRSQLELDDTDLWINVAQAVERKLKRAKDFAPWLQSTVGSLHAENAATITALSSLGIPIVTTNYDNILEEITGLEPVTWMDVAECVEVFRGDRAAIIHIHGHFEKPESVILGVSSYEDILRDERAQQFLKALNFLQSAIYVGYGKGLKDPNFGKLLDWRSQVLSDHKYSDFRLVREPEIASIETEHKKGERIELISFGSKHAELEPFLVNLAEETEALSLIHI